MTRKEFVQLHHKVQKLQDSIEKQLKTLFKTQQEKNGLEALIEKHADECGR
jgi:hypothetical protein